MSDAVTSTSARQGARLLRRAARALAPFRSVDATGRMSESVRRAELAGLVFAFRARLFAIAVVSLVFMCLVAWPRNAWYLGFSAAFFVLGYVPYRYCHHPLAERMKLAFVILDVALVTVAILVPPPDGISIDWPVQTRLRGQTFLFLLLLLGEAALTYSPRRVVWTGASIVLAWSVGFAVLDRLPTTLRYADVVAAGDVGDADLLRMFVDPTYVSPASFVVQVVATALLTVLTALAVLRARSHLLAEARSDVVRSDLALYVSPDLADAVAERAASGFGEPVVRDVAVLFADVVGFTGLAETLPPERTFALLRSYQERSTRVVLAHGGTLDKYLGDGLMATFGALHDDAEAASRAVACAFDLVREIGRWNEKRSHRGLAPLRLAVGVHHGPAMVGHLGSDRRVEFTVVGDVVNVASRLEKASRELGSRIVASDACLRASGLDAVTAGFERAVEVTLRGRRGAMTVHVSEATRPGADRASGHATDVPTGAVA